MSFEYWVLLLSIIFNIIFLSCLTYLLKRMKNIKNEVIKKSRSILEGKFKEQLAPLFPEFKYNPTDARFIGSPIDYIIFNGIANNKLENIIFLEVKTKKSKLTEREARIKKIIENGKIKFEELRI
ncbi:MAG: Holliday junction resolvase [Candidatus Aenigmarchaeota archaeon ex4484_56]|nr:MAG: Holliday junction resolvase [Candidatus Aenigmarchaeota archaeon ex4484_56]